MSTEHHSTTVRRDAPLCAALCAVAALSVAACGLRPIVRQRGLAALHAAVSATCRADRARCAPLTTCSIAVRGALREYQRMAEELARGGDGEDIALSALRAEEGARAECARAGVPE